MLSIFICELILFRDVGTKTLRGHGSSISLFIFGRLTIKQTC